MAGWTLYVSSRGTKSPLLGLGPQMLNVLGSRLHRRRAFAGCKPFVVVARARYPSSKRSEAATSLVCHSFSLEAGCFPEREKERGKKKKKKISSVYIFLNGEIK